MTASANNSTSAAKKSVLVGTLEHMGATKLIFGMVQAYTHLPSNLKPIWKMLIFCGSSSSVLSLGTILEAQEFSESGRILYSQPYSFAKMIFSHSLKFPVAVGRSIMYLKIEYTLRSTPVF